jgi:hypothetical protein
MWLQLRVDRLDDLKVLRDQTEAALRIAYDPEHAWKQHTSLQDIKIEIDALERERGGPNPRIIRSCLRSL